MSNAAYHVFADDLGWALAVAEDGHLTCLAHADSREEAEGVRRDLHPEAVHAPDAAPLPDLRKQLDEYFAGQRREFDLPLAPQGTEFQRRVWRALEEIPFGETRSYADVARAVDRPRGYQAVGQANHHNPIGVVIPCHRVIAADGGLGGYAGGPERKRKLLSMEGSYPGGEDPQRSIPW